MIRAQVLKNGALKITADNEGRAELKYQCARGYYEAEAEVAENLRYHQNFEFVRPEWVAALTDAPIITDDLGIADDGEPDHIGNIWWFPNYMVEDPWETLKNTGRVIFEPGD